MALDPKTIDARLTEMDRQGIDVHAVSLNQAQFHYWAEPELAAQIVKVQTKKLPEICALHWDRFVALGGVLMTTVRFGFPGRKPRDRRTCTSKAMSGSPAAAPAGTPTLGIA